MVEFEYFALSEHNAVPQLDSGRIFRFISRLSLHLASFVIKADISNKDVAGRGDYLDNTGGPKPEIHCLQVPAIAV